MFRTTNLATRLLALASLTMLTGCLEDDPTDDDRDISADVPAPDVGADAPDASADADVVEDTADTDAEVADDTANADVADDTSDADVADDVSPSDLTLEVLHMEYNENPDGLTADIAVVLSAPPPPAIASLVEEELTQEVPLGLPTTQRLILESTGLDRRPSTLIVDGDEQDCVLTTTSWNTYRCTGSNGVDWQVGPSDGFDGVEVIVSATPSLMAEAGYDSGTSVVVDGVEYNFLREEFELRVPTDFSPGEGGDVEISAEPVETSGTELAKAKNRRVEFILQRGVVIDDIFTAESTPGVYELVAVSNSGDSGVPPEMQAFANGVELEQMDDRVQRVFSAGVEEFGETEIEVLITFFDGEEPVDTGRISVVLDEQWATGFTPNGETIGVRFDRTADRGDQLTVTLDGESSATRFEAELVGEESTVFAFGSFVTQWRSKVWVNDVFDQENVEIVVIAENEFGFEEVTRVANGSETLADRPDTYPNASARRGLLLETSAPPTPTADIIHLFAEGLSDSIEAQTIVRFMGPIPSDFSVELELTGFEPVVRSDFDFALGAVDVERPDGPVVVTIEGFDDEFVVDREVVETSPEGVEELSVTLDPRGSSLLITLVGSADVMEAAGAVPGASIVNIGGEPEPFGFYDIVYITPYDRISEEAEFGLVGTAYAGEEVLDVAEVAGSLDEDSLVEEVVVLDRDDRVEVAITAQVETLEPTTVSLAVTSDEGEFFVEEQVTPAAVERVFEGDFESLSVGDVDTVTFSMTIQDDGGGTLEEFELSVEVDGGWFDVEAGDRVLSVNISRDAPGSTTGDVRVSVIGEDGVQGTVAQAQEIAGVTVSIAQDGPTITPDVQFLYARRGYTFVSPDTGLGGLLEEGGAELVIDVAQEGRLTQTVTGGLGPVPSISTSRKFVKKYKGKTKFDRKMNESFTDPA